MRKLTLLVCAALATSIPLANAQTRSNILNPQDDPRGQPELTVCSQNLENFGSLPDSQIRSPSLTAEAYEEKARGLTRRMAKAKCDVVAVQEVLGKDDEVAALALKELASALHRATNRTYSFKVGPTLDKFSHVGFLFADDRVQLLNYLTYEKVELPKLTDKEKPRLFVRAPLEIQLSVKPLGGSIGRSVVLLNIHFKSRRGGGGDPAELEWETYRMQMAEAIRRIAERRYAKAFSSGDPILMILGDRNSHFDTASARILEGTLTLNNFKEGGTCRLSKRGVPLCQGGTLSAQKLFSVLTSDPQSKLSPGTEQFNGEYSWLDDIMMPSEALRTAWTSFDSDGDYDSGVVYEPTKASDHALVYVRLNW